MLIKTIPIKKIKAAAYNPRVDLQPGDIEYEKLKKSLDEFDLVEPLIWNEKTGNLVGGHQRLKILIARGDKETDVSVVNLTTAKEKALNIALNKIGGDWDIPKLKVVLADLNEVDLDPETFGFSVHEIESLLAGIDDPLDEWKEMPEYINEDCAPFKKLIVAFKTEQDFVDFQKLIGQSLTLKTKSILFPQEEKQEIEEYVDDGQE